MVGALLFQNVNRIDWRLVKESAPGFIVLFFIPFTFSLLQGVLIGYVIYLTVNLCSGDLWYDTLAMIEIYFPQWYMTYLHSDIKTTDNIDDNNSGNNNGNNNNNNNSYSSAIGEENTLSHSLVPDGDHDKWVDNQPPAPSLIQLKRQESSSTRSSFNRTQSTDHYIMGFSENDIIPTTTFPSGANQSVGADHSVPPPLPGTPTRLQRSNSSLAGASQRPSSISTRMRGDTITDNPFVTGS